MKAFEITWPKRKGSARASVDLGYKYHLPELDCPKCGIVCRLYEYPAFNFDFLTTKKFATEQEVSVSEFERLRQRIIKAAGRPTMVIPGAAIGRPTGICSTSKLADFEWGRVHFPQISKRAYDLLAAEGIDLITAEISLKCRGTAVDTHLALQVEPIPLLTAESMIRRQITLCPICGNFDVPWLTTKIPEIHEFKRSAWPKGKHLVVSAEVLRVLPSEEFMEAVRKHNLTGITFEEIGSYV